MVWDTPRWRARKTLSRKNYKDWRKCEKESNKKARESKKRRKEEKKYRKKFNKKYHFPDKEVEHTQLVKSPEELLKKIKELEGQLNSRIRIKNNGENQ